MKHLLLDLGNTRYKWMLRSALPTGEIGSAVYARTLAADALVLHLTRHMSFDRLLVSSVRDATFNKSLAAACREAGVAAAEFISVPEPSPIPLAYHDVSGFGVDRYLNLIGAMQRYRPPFIVVSAGTAVTFDAVDESARHIGGCIYPGRALQYASLAKGAARIDAQQMGGVSSLFADSTQAGVNGGVEQGFVSAIEGILAAMQPELGDQATVLLTGGDADWLFSRLAPSILVDSTLLFEGINQASCRDQ